MDGEGILWIVFFAAAFFGIAYANRNNKGKTPSADDSGTFDRLDKDRDDYYYYYDSHDDPPNE